MIIVKEETFVNIKEQLKNYEYYSMHYTEYDDIQNYDVICCNEQIILLYGYNGEIGLYEFHWAANNVAFLLEEIKKLNKKGLITFIPKEWINEFKNNNFDMYAVWNDYFNNDISKHSKHIEPIEILSGCDCKEASEVTLSCINQSRGFSGQTETWMKQWIEGSEINAAALGSKDNAVLIHRDNNLIVGVACIAIYGHESEKGTTLWVREIAVRPEYQGRGIAKKLLNQTLSYGESHGAKRAFLMADELNGYAIRLYEKVGFTANKDEASNDMILK